MIGVISLGLSPSQELESRGDRGFEFGINPPVLGPTALGTKTIFVDPIGDPYLDIAVERHLRDGSPLRSIFHHGISPSKNYSRRGRLILGCRFLGRVCMFGFKFSIHIAELITF